MQILNPSRQTAELTPEDVNFGSLLSPELAVRPHMRSLASRHRHRRGFTLIEILLVVVILGILGALVYPHFANARADAADKAARTQLQGLRSQIEMYKVQHGGALPDLPTVTELG